MVARSVTVLLPVLPVPRLFGRVNRVMVVTLTGTVMGWDASRQDDYVPWIC